MTLQDLLLVAPVLLFSMVAHEYAHGWAALRHGDPTAYQLGRLTWNPVKHIDPFMTIILPALVLYMSGGQFLFGGAKPVPVNPRNYRNYKRADIVVSLAGIVTNLILAVVITAAIVAFGMLARGAPGLDGWITHLQRMLVFGIWINILLAGFNLLPIPPLDGSHVFKYVLPPRWALSYERMGRYGIMILLVLLMLGRDIIMPYFAFLRSIWLSAVRVVFPFILPSVFSP